MMLSQSAEPEILVGGTGRVEGDSSLFSDII